MKIDEPGDAMKLFSLSLLVFLGLSPAAGATKFPAQGRLFVGSTAADPSNLNQEMRAQGVNEFKAITKYGVEITYPLTSFLDGGLRYTKTYINNTEVNPTPLMDYHALLSQDSVMLIARVPFLNTQFLKFDVFGGVGGTNTSLKIKTAPQDIC